MSTFTHLNEKGEVHMVDVTPKPDVSRMALASGRIYLRPETLNAIAKGAVVKGNVLATAQVAGTMAVKQTWAIIPMCHQIPVGSVTIEFVQTETFIEAKCRFDGGLGCFAYDMGYGEVSRKGCIWTIPGNTDRGYPCYRKNKRIIIALRG